jgi:16S rRNA processing protein RimM
VTADRPSRRVAGTRRERGPASPDKGEPDLVVVGRVGRPQGIKGEVTVEVRTDSPEERFAPGASLATDAGTLTVETVRDHSGKLVVRFEGVVDRNGAEALRGTVLQVDARTLPDLDDEDEYYDTQLVGLRASLQDGTAVGTVAEVLHLPHGDVLVVAREGAPELLVPFVRAMVPVVDLPQGVVVLDPPPGLLDLASAEPAEPTEPTESREA